MKVIFLVQISRFSQQILKKKGEKNMNDYRELGYLSEEEFLEDYLGCDENWTLDDFFDSYDPE